MNEKVILFTSECPVCRALQGRLNAKNVIFEIKDVRNDENALNSLIEAGFHSAPVLEVDGHKMSSKEALKWVNER